MSSFPAPLDAILDGLMNTFLQFKELQTPKQKSFESSIKGCSTLFTI